MRDVFSSRPAQTVLADEGAAPPAGIRPRLWALSLAERLDVCNDKTKTLEIQAKYRIVKTKRQPLREQTTKMKKN